MEKMTKKEILNSMLTIEAIAENPVYVEFINKELDGIAKRAEQARARNLKKAQESDALRKEVYETLSDTDFMTIPDIVAAIGRPEITTAKVTARLTSLGKTYEIVKAEVTVEAGETKRKVMGYKAATPEETAAMIAAVESNTLINY